MNEQFTKQSVESQNDSTKESINTYEFRSQVREEISSLREKVDQILKALNAKNDCDPEVIMEEIHRYPNDGQDFVRCAIIGLIRGDEYSRSGQAILTTRVDDIFDNPNTAPEKVAAFVSQLANPALIDVCRRMSQGYRYRSELKMICNLTEDELDNALEPLLEWGFLKWKQEEDEPSLHEEGPGIRFIIPLIFLTQEARRLKEDMPSNWSLSIWAGANGKPPRKLSNP